MKLPSQPVEVAAGLVFKQGRLLVAQRKINSHLGGLWEFPGGKKELAESLSQCLSREILEELRMEIAVGKVYQVIDHRYPDKFVRLHFFVCQWLAGVGDAVGCERFEWVNRTALPDFEFPAADAVLVTRLVADDSLWK